MTAKPNPVLIGGLVAVLVLVAFVVWGISSSGDDSEASTSPTPAPTAATPSTSPTPSVAPRVVRPAPAKKPGVPSLTSDVPLAAGAKAKVTRIEAVRSEANMPGEIAGPALRFTIDVTAGDKAVDLAPVVVNAYYGRDRVPAIGTGGPGGKPLAGKLAAGKSTTGVYVFNIPRSARNAVFLEFSWSPKVKPVILQGRVF